MSFSVGKSFFKQAHRETTKTLRIVALKWSGLVDIYFKYTFSVWLSQIESWLTTLRFITYTLLTHWMQFVGLDTDDSVATRQNKSNTQLRNLSVWLMTGGHLPALSLSVKNVFTCFLTWPSFLQVVTSPRVPSSVWWSRQALTVSSWPQTQYSTEISHSSTPSWPGSSTAGRYTSTGMQLLHVAIPIWILTITTLEWEFQWHLWQCNCVVYLSINLYFICQITLWIYWIETHRRSTAPDFPLNLGNDWS